MASASYLSEVVVFSFYALGLNMICLPLFLVDSGDLPHLLQQQNSQYLGQILLAA
jgi:hypothetical protein